jgi:hypothetical protein
MPLSLGPQPVPATPPRMVRNQLVYFDDNNNSAASWPSDYSINPAPPDNLYDNQAWPFADRQGQLLRIRDNGTLDQTILQSMQGQMQQFATLRVTHAWYMSTWDTSIGGIDGWYFWCAVGQNTSTIPDNRVCFQARTDGATNTEAAPVANTLYALTCVDGGLGTISRINCGSITDFIGRWVKTAWLWTRANTSVEFFIDDVSVGVLNTPANIPSAFTDELFSRNGSSAFQTFGGFSSNDYWQIIGTFDRS